MPRMLTGGCICGAVEFTVPDSFQTFKLCHCDFCKKASGGSNVANLFGDPDWLTWTKGADQLTSHDVQNSLVRRVFCKTCGTSLPFIAQNGAILVVPTGALNTQPSIAPQEVVFWDKRAHWVDQALDLMTKQPRT